MRSGKRSHSLFKGSFIDSIFAHLTRKGAHADPAALCGESNVAAEIIEFLRQILLFLFLQPLAERGVKGIAAPAWMRLKADFRQIDVFDGSAGVENDGAPDNILQFTNVARPGVV